MIEHDGEPTTPKLLAQDIILDSISARGGYWHEFMSNEYEKMTPRERRMVTEQLKKQFARVQKMFGQEGWGFG